MPAIVPAAMRDLVHLSNAFHGDLVISGPDDVVAYAAPLVPHGSAFCAFLGAMTYSDLYWGAIAHGLLRSTDLRVAPDDWFQLALGVRRTVDVLDVQTPSRTTRILCQRRRLPNGWTVHLRLALDAVRAAGAAPLSVFDAIDRSRETARLAAALNHLPVGVLFTDRRGRVRWMNDTASTLLADGTSVSAPAQRLQFADRAVGTTFFAAVDGVLSGGAPAYVAVPHRDQHRLLSVTAAPYPGEAMVLFAPDDPTDAQLDEALAALGLTRTERRIAASVGRGETPKSISATTGQAVNTIRCHLANTYRKLGLNMGVTSQRDLARLVGQVTSIAGICR
ncbi:helix-turn-helix transcriptional regulator [Azospirillum canadense]|uniref:helix-turn-helix transcriptional regulator n=1 Tax=Azospirillum canadense TaxID=403962 RepID=UPI002226A9D3|nr:helix-turn-helix transcriptional regulator [Azospirillum canadense]MCW2240709.1 DNA-binding CsgD family transcriptional regulator [Azospirillum canadense]